MIDLLDFFKKHSSDWGYYQKHSARLSRLNASFKYYDSEEVIGRFRAICKPPETAYDQSNDEFILICFWLHRNGYVIKEFPNLLSRPISLRAFAYDDIRKYIWQHIDKDSTVRWHQRKALCDRLSITSDKVFQHIPNEVEEKVRLISTRNADFDGMELDEKLENLNNLIEHLLKPRSNGKYISLDYDNIFFGYIDEQDVKNFRLETQCFRHASADNIAKRGEMPAGRKTLLVQLGIFICIHIYDYLKK